MSDKRCDLSDKFSASITRTFLESDDIIIAGVGAVALAGMGVNFRAECDGVVVIPLLLLLRLLPCNSDGDLDCEP